MAALMGSLLRGIKRQASPDARETKRSREGGGEELLPDVADVEGKELLEALEAITRVLRDCPFGLRALDCQWGIKRRLFSLLPRILESADAGWEARKAVVALIDQVIRSGYAMSALDRCKLVEAGAWKPALTVLKDRWSKNSDRLSAVRLYIHLAEHVSFYDDFSGYHEEFWKKEVFDCVLKHMPLVFREVPDNILADQWDLVSPELEASLKTVGCFMMYWLAAPTFNIKVEQVMPVLNGILDIVTKFDDKFGQQISTKVRGDFLEELVRVCGVLTQYVLNKYDDSERRSASTREEARVQAMALLNFLVRVLMLRIPTIIQKADSTSPGSQNMPVDERQIDAEWIEGLLEHVQGKDEDVIVPPRVLVDLFSTLVDMPLEEQKYRLECASPLVPPFVYSFQNQLKQNIVPAELMDVKAVMNAVLQDDSAVTSDLLEELSFFPCLLDFATKRATIHGICERQKMQGSSADPIRLVVPRDNVLDGVCDRLNLQDQSARIEVPLEIEFRSGYSDNAGNEVMEDGEDQGGLRRQWLDRATRYFISSDLMTSPSEDASHLADANGLSANRRPRGLVYVPSSEAVCRCVQDDWEEQFELFGCVLGFAILYKETVPVHFGHNFLRAVFGLKTDAQDLLPLLEVLDKTLHTKLKYILDGTYSLLGDTLADALDQSNLPKVFALTESHCPELVKSAELKEGGGRLEVTEENKKEFVHLMLDRLLISGIARQVECFRRGLHRVVPDHVTARVAELMSVKEIELLVCGSEEIDVEDWQQHTQYENGFTNESQPVRWFWDSVRSMSQTQRAALLSFTTGSSQVPSGGFRFLQPELFTIQRVAVTDRYPEAHTCANTIDLPQYESKEELEERLLFAVRETGDAFGRR